MSETKTTYPCGCVIKTIASGTPVAGTLTQYCEAHNPYKNTAPKVEKIED
jgi:hypothetical protein